MDTSGFYPQLSDDDPIFETALYSQLMRTQLGKVRHAEWTRLGQNDAPANASWGPGMFGTSPLNADSTTTKNAEFVTAGAGNDQIKVLEEGVYAFTWNLKNVSGNSHGFWLRLTDTGNTVWHGSIPAATIPNGETICLVVPNLFLPANTTVQVRFACTGVSQPVDHRIKLTKI